MEGANRASALTRRLLAFARSEPLLPQTLDPDDLIHGMTDLIDRTIGDQIKVETVSGAQGWKIWVDRHQLENAILNLAVNARDAMPKGGQLRIETRNVDLVEGDELVRKGVSPGPHVMLAVQDTGCGMDKETRMRIFEPFFTTKEKGRGTGLGLSAVYGAVQSHKGTISVNSQVGKGTVVTMRKWRP